jgi:hypothetical protein
VLDVTGLGSVCPEYCKRDVAPSAQVAVEQLYTDTYPCSVSNSVNVSVSGAAPEIIPDMYTYAPAFGPLTVPVGHAHTTGGYVALTVTLAQSSPRDPPQPLRYWPAGQDVEQAAHVPEAVLPQPRAYCPSGQAQGAQAVEPAAGIPASSARPQGTIGSRKHSRCTNIQRDPSTCDARVRARTACGAGGRSCHVRRPDSIRQAGVIHSSMTHSLPLIAEYGPSGHVKHPEAPVKEPSHSKFHSPHFY